MAAPIVKRRRVLAAKVETTAGTAETLAAADGKFNVYDVEIQPNIEFGERSGQSALSRIPGVPGAHGGSCTFKMDLIGGSSAPDWSTTFLPAVGLGQATLTFTPTSVPPEVAGATSETLTIGVYEQGLFKEIYGAMGNVVFRFANGRPVVGEFTFTGVWAAPSDVALIAPDYPATVPPRWAGGTFTLAKGSGTWTPKASELTIDLGNNVVLRPDASLATGYHSAVIADRRINGTINPEIQLLADISPGIWNDWLGSTERALSTVLGSAGNQITFSVPKLQITNVQEGDRDGIAISEITWQANRSADAGDDEFSMVFA